MMLCESCGDQLTVNAGKRPVSFCDHILCENCVAESGVCPLCNVGTGLVGEARINPLLLKAIKTSAGSNLKPVNYCCDEHTDMKVKFICSTHKAALCAECAWEHRDHEHSVKKYSSDKVQDDLKKVCELLDNHINHCQEVRKSATNAIPKGKLFQFLENLYCIMLEIAEDEKPTEQDNDILSGRERNIRMLLDLFGNGKPELILDYSSDEHTDSSTDSNEDTEPPRKVPKTMARPKQQEVLRKRAKAYTWPSENPEVGKVYELWYDDKHNYRSKPVSQWDADVKRQWTMLVELGKELKFVNRLKCYWNYADGYKVAFVVLMFHVARKLKLGKYTDLAKAHVCGCIGSPRDVANLFRGISSEIISAVFADFIAPLRESRDTKITDIYLVLTAARALKLSDHEMLNEFKEKLCSLEETNKL